MQPNSVGGGGRLGSGCRGVAVEDVGVDHRGSEVAVAEWGADDSDVSPVQNSEGAAHTRHTRLIHIRIEKNQRVRSA